MVQDGTPQTKGVTDTKIIVRGEMLPLAELCQLWSLLLVVYRVFCAVKDTERMQQSIALSQYQAPA